MHVVVPDPDGNYPPFRTPESKETMKMCDFDTLDKDAVRSSQSSSNSALTSLWLVEASGDKAPHRHSAVCLSYEAAFGEEG